MFLLHCGFQISKVTAILLYSFSVLILVYSSKANLKSRLSEILIFGEHATAQSCVLYSTRIALVVQNAFSSPLHLFKYYLPFERKLNPTAYLTTLAVISSFLSSDKPFNTYSLSPQASFLIFCIIH